MNKKLKIGVLFGGQSGEHEVSLVSASSVMEALDKSKYDVVPIGITKEGKWIAGPESMKLLKSGKDVKESRGLVSADPTEKGLVRFEEQSESQKLDVIFPVLHGPLGEDGTVQGLLELASIPYIGAGVLGSAVGMDKIIQKQLFIQAGLPVVDYIWFLSSEVDNKIDDIENKFEYPVFVKPVNMGSSVGISKAHNKEELKEAIKEAKKYDRKILIERGAEDVREIEVSVLGNDKPEASVAGEIVASGEFYDYDAKYVDGKSEAIIPAEIPDALMKKIQKIACSAFRVLDLAGMARVDFFLSRDKIYLNEVNTIPGFTSISMYPKLWQASGLSYSKLLDRLIELAIERHGDKKKLLTSYEHRKEWYLGK
ncbi:D-alanine--D-alanine ligase [Candidatus Falkowbacteria bacterium]|nr:D-alanine--D-alanine ligase [Candidatus Falkowbacteria bacterium]